MNSAVHAEVEIKLPLTSLQPLLDAGFELIETSPRHFEDNWLFDSAEGTLKSQRSALRLRLTAQQTLLTFKGPPLGDKQFKIRDEIELEIGDSESMIQILRMLGFEKCFRYQKYRTAVRVSRGDTTLLAMIDETPLGDFIELEGAGEAIVAVATELGFEPAQFITESYIALQAERCRAQGTALLDLVFAPSADELAEGGR